MSKEKTEQITTEPGSSAKLKVEIPVVVENKAQAKPAASTDKPREINGPKGLEPTRYGDWEAKGRCYDF